MPNLNPANITSPKYLEGLSDEELLALHEQVHSVDRQLRQSGVAREYRTVNAHVFIVEEMQKRNLEHSIVDDLDRESRRLVNNRETPPDWLTKALEEAEDQILVPAYVSLVGSSVNDDTPQDLDILIREDPEIISEGWRDSVMLLARNLIDKDLPVHVLANPSGPHISQGRGYVPLFDLVLRPRKNPEIITSAGNPRSTRYILLGVGAMNSPTFKPAGLIVDHPKGLIILDGLPPKMVVEKAKAWLLTDDKGELTPAQKKLAADAGGPIPSVRQVEIDGLRITPHKVEHTNHSTYGYLIDDNSHKIVWAPEFFKFPDWAAGADLMFAEAASWDRPILFAGNVGGHMAILDVADQAQKKGVKRLVFAHIGRPTIRAIKSGQRPPFGEFGKEGKSYRIESQSDQTSMPVVNQSDLKPGDRYRMTKPLLLGETDFASIDELWDRWGQKALEEAGSLYVSPKVDGFRLSLSRTDGHITLRSEDHKRDFASLPQMKPLTQSLAGDVIVEGEFVVRVGKKFVARPQIASFLAGNLDGDPHVYLYDILYAERDIHNEPWEKRFEILKEIGDKFGPNLHVLPQVRVTSEQDLIQAAKKMAIWNGGPPIEGVVIRKGDMPYKFGPDNNYSKVKKYLEIKFHVLGVHRTKNGWTYEIALLDPPQGAPEKDVISKGSRKLFKVGRTFVTKQKLANPGDTLNVAVEEILWNPKIQEISTGKPRPLGPDKSRPAYTVAQTLALAKKFQSLKEFVEQVSEGTNRVPPHGPLSAKLAVVGDAPGRTEREIGIPFTGPSGKFLKELLSELGVDPESEVYWANVYEGDEGEITDIKTARLGRKLLTKLSKMPNLRAVLALGEVAGNALGEIKASVEEHRKHQHEVKTGVPIIVSYHSAALLRTGQKESKLYRDFREDVMTAVSRAGLGKLKNVSVIGALDTNESMTRAEAAALNWERSWQDAMPLSGRPQPFILHAHFRGLTEEESRMSLKELLNTNNSLHFDLRLGTDRFKGWFGGTLFAGTTAENREELKIFRMMQDPEQRLQGAIKMFGPAAWLKVGLPKPFVSGPGEIGATSGKYAKFFALDHGTWQLGMARLHAVEIFLNGQKLKGRFMWQFAPLAEGRSWLLTRPKDQEPFATKHTKEEIIKELRRKRQKWLVWPKNEDSPLGSKELIDVRKVDVKQIYMARVIDADARKRFTLGVVMVPDEPANDVVASAEVIEQACWEYQCNSRGVGVMHRDGSEGSGICVENYISRCPTWRVGDQEITPGSWVLGAIWDEETWERITQGDLQGGGWSVEGFALVSSILPMTISGGVS